MNELKSNNFAVSELANNAEYVEACETIKKLNSTITFARDPKLLGELIVNKLANENTVKYYELIDKFNKTNSSDVMIEISNVLDDAANQLHYLQFPGSPGCQKRMETYCTPQLYWALEAAKVGNIDGYKIEQRIIKYGGMDRFNAPEELIKAIQIKFAYEGDSDMQYELIERYDPNEKHYFNAPAINEKEKSQEKMDYWIDKLSHNPNINISNNFVLKLIKDKKTPEVDKAMRKALEQDNIDNFYILGQYFGAETKIGYELLMKSAYSSEFAALPLTSLEILLEYYKKINDKEGFKKFLIDWVKNSTNEDKWAGAQGVYKHHYELFKWLGDPEFDVVYLDYIIKNCDDEFWSNATKQEKRKHLSIPLFGGKPKRKD